MSQPSLVLYDHPLSSYCQKVRIVLREKGLAFTKRTPPSDEKEMQQFAADVNPKSEVPALVVTDEATGKAHTIFDSRIIAEYLDDRFPDTKPLLPKDPELRAKARETEHVMDNQGEAINWGMGEVTWMKRATGQLAEQIKAEAARQTLELQRWLEGRFHEDSGWLTGPEFGSSDVIAAVIVNRSSYYGFNPAKGSKLEVWLDKVRQRPAVRETLAEFAEAAKTMAGMSDVFLSGKRKRQYRDARLEFLVRSGGISIVEEGIKNQNIKFSWPEGSKS